MSSNTRIPHKSVLENENAKGDQYEQYLRSLESNSHKNTRPQEEVFETPAFINKNENQQQRSDAQVRQPVSNLRKLKNITQIMGSKTSLKPSETLELDTDELFENFEKFFKVSFTGDPDLPHQPESLEQIRKSLTNLFSEKERAQSKLKPNSGITRDSLNLNDTSALHRPGSRHGTTAALTTHHPNPYALKIESNYDSNVSNGAMKIEEGYGDMRRLDRLPVINKRASFTNLNPLDTMKSDDYLADNFNHLQRTRNKLEKQINNRNKSLDYKVNQAPIVLPNNAGSRKAHHKPLEDITNILNATGERKYSDYIDINRVQKPFKDFFDTHDDPYDYNRGYEQPGSDSARAYLDARKRARNEIIQKISNDIFPTKKSPRLYENNSTKTGKFIQTTKYPPKERISLRENVPSGSSGLQKMLRIEEPALVNFRPESRKGQNSTRLTNNTNSNVNMQAYRYNNAATTTVIGHGRSTSVPKGIVITRF